MNDTFYREEIIDHYKNPCNMGHLKSHHVKTNGSNATCGDYIEIEVKFNNPVKKGSINNSIKELKFNGKGCSISIAAASMVSREIQGKDISYILGLSYNDVSKLLKMNLTASRVKCATLFLDTLKAGLKAYINSTP